MKSYKTYGAAKKAAGQNPIVKIGDLYIVGTTLEGCGLDEIQLIDTNRHIVGNITMRHLNRLGNANWAERSAMEPWSREQPQIWKKESAVIIPRSSLPAQGVPRG
jgi:hypothetical protein